MAVRSVRAQMGRRPSSCVPSGAILTTFVNEHHASSLQLQTSALPACLATRYLALCSPPRDPSDVASLPPVCMQWGTALEASDFSDRPSHAFTTVTWVRWEMIHLALSTSVRECMPHVLCACACAHACMDCRLCVECTRPHTHTWRCRMFTGVHKEVCIHLHDPNATLMPH